MESQLRPIAPADAEACTAICYQAFCAVNARHGFAPEFPCIDAVAGLMRMLVSSPHVLGVAATAPDGRIVGSNFLWLGAIAGVGPVSVDPTVQDKSIGRRLMQWALDAADERRLPGVRLVQAAFNARSMSLYAKLGFDVREPLVCMQGQPVGEAVPGHAVRRATAADIDACAALCVRVHGHDRTGELAAAVEQGTARLVEHAGRISGYATDTGFFGHVAAESNADLIALLGAAERFSGPGFLLPSRNGEVFRWCLTRGLRVVQPMTLMSRGLYNEPRGAFMPSILF